MSPRVRLVPTWTVELVALLPHVRVTQVRPLALFVLGMLWAGRVSLRAVAATLPLAIADASSERRLYRWLRNKQVDVGAPWGALLPTLLASRAGSCCWSSIPRRTLAPPPSRCWGSSAANGSCRSPGGSCLSNPPGRRRRSTCSRR
jgi:hypothetical protein